MTWSKELPIQEGHYWCSYVLPNGERFTEMQCIVKSTFQPNVLVIFDGDPEMSECPINTLREITKCTDYRWYGPLLPPELTT